MIVNHKATYYYYNIKSFVLQTQVVTPKPTYQKLRTFLLENFCETGCATAERFLKLFQNGTNRVGFSEMLSDTPPPPPPSINIEMMGCKSFIQHNHSFLWLK